MIVLFPSPNTQGSGSYCILPHDRALSKSQQTRPGSCCIQVPTHKTRVAIVSSHMIVLFPSPNRQDPGSCCIQVPTHKTLVAIVSSHMIVLFPIPNTQDPGSCCIQVPTDKTLVAFVSKSQQTRPW
ncbi:hypothetical protein PoB_005919900 [Plakobranchus ocellatus]|uniref:Uncharacterized protein n=1 Tax=Plakobranchus ocellatus TaxID=259542 RepID=A0AAV4CMN9_9GAST|nr:hypothetical protein PoB_005919900 [Plakobranchus ocellatus]